MMKKITKLLLLMVLVAPAAFAASHDQADKAAAPTAKSYTYKTPKLNRAQIDELLAKPDQLLIIDVRRPDEISKNGTFPVYLNIQAKELESGLAFISRDRNIVTVSNHASRAGAAADLLAEKGFKVVGAIGSQNYEEEGGKITKIAIPAPKADASAPKADQHAGHKPS